MPTTSQNNPPDGGPAFPLAGTNNLNNTVMLSRGMTLRDYFAAKALAAMPRVALDDEENGGWAYKNIAAHAYKMADAMLAERAA
jgi:hypothetical protein